MTVTRNERIKNMSPAQIVQRLWNHCNVLRDDGIVNNEKIGRYKTAYLVEDQIRDRYILTAFFLGLLISRNLAHLLFQFSGEFRVFR